MRGLLGATGVLLRVFTLLRVSLDSGVYLPLLLASRCIFFLTLTLPLMTIRVRTPPSGTYSLDPNPILMLILSLFLTLCSGAVWEWRNKWRTAKNDQIAQLSFAVGQEIAARAAGGTSSAEVVQLKADYAKLTMRYEQAIDSAADAQRGNLEAIGNAVKV